MVDIFGPQEQPVTLKESKKRGQDARPSAGASHASHSPTYRGPCKRRWTALGWTLTACACMCDVSYPFVLCSLTSGPKTGLGVLSHMTVIQPRWIGYYNHNSVDYHMVIIDCLMLKGVPWFTWLTNTIKHWGDGARLFGGLWCLQFAVGTPYVLQRCVQSKCMQFFGSIFGHESRAKVVTFP